MWYIIYINYTKMISRVTVYALTQTFMHLKAMCQYFVKSLFSLIYKFLVLTLFALKFYTGCNVEGAKPNRFINFRFLYAWFYCRVAIMYLFEFLFMDFYQSFVLYSSIKYMEREWKTYVEEYNSPEILLSNCIAASAFLTYCGPMGIDRR